MKLQQHSQKFYLLKNTEKALAAAKEELLTYEAKALVNNEGVVTAAFNQRTMQELQKIARIIVTEQKDVIALLVSENEGKLQFVAARGNNVSKA